MDRISKNIGYTVPMNPGNDYDQAVDDCRVSFSHRFFQGKLTLPVSTTPEFLGLFINLGNDIEYRIDIRQGTLMTDYFNFIYLPRGLEYDSLELRELPFVRQDGRRRFISFQFSKVFLDRWVQQFPVIRNILICCSEKKIGVINVEGFKITYKMYSLIFDIIRCDSKDVLRDVFLRAKVLDILSSCLEHATMSIRCQKAWFPQKDIKRIMATRKFVLQNIREQFTVDFLANRVGIDRVKLEKGFYLLYGSTISDFQSHERIKLGDLL